MYVVYAKEPTIVHRWTKQAIVVKDALRIGPINIYIFFQFYYIYWMRVIWRMRFINLYDKTISMA